MCGFLVVVVVTVYFSPPDAAGRGLVTVLRFQPLQPFDFYTKSSGSRARIFSP